MIHRYKSLLGVGMAIGLTMMGGTALAAPPPAPAPKFTVTGLSIQSVTTSGSNTDVNVAITVFDTGVQPGTWEFPNPTFTGGNPNALPTITITPTTKPVTATASSLISSPDPTVGPKESATATYQFVIPTSQLGPLGNDYTIELVYQPTSPIVFHMYQPQDSITLASSSPRPSSTSSFYNTAPVYDYDPIVSVVGQLPEVPWAAALPLVALGTVGAIWVTRRNTHRRSAAS
ncbi:MAG: hypothetical protein OWR62_11795 [Sulfobacillus thermotolerans]|uniref:Uncharacterized protein n=1 Tax=Sulfobacillus thermotolerans TaxID=338644 RepID=A0ABM6RUJ7_9FIRM|nr:hypothetical protein BXT84_15195 [Sulfobacillus thermotolerans]MCY0909059.1 hypothetical protein [Sulfobacillus thermotolerans]